MCILAWWSMIYIKLRSLSIDYMFKEIIQYACPSDGFLHSDENRVGGVMVSVLASGVVDRGFEPRSGQTKDYKMGVCCFSDKDAALRR